MVNQSRKRDYIMSKLNKMQKYAIQWLNSQHADHESIAKELDITVKQVTNELKDAPQTQTIQKQEPTLSAKELMITHTAQKKTNSIAIMTKEASEIADEAKKKMPSKNTDNIKGIFRPKK